MARYFIIRTPASKDEVLRLIRELPRLLKGRSSLAPGPLSSFLVRLGLTVQRFLFVAFRQKSLRQADAAGLRWRPLAPATIRKKQRTAPRNAQNILREFNWLIRSMKPTLRPQAAVPKPATQTYQIFRTRPGVVEIGSNRPFVLTHHRGTARIPRRRLWPHPRQWPTVWWDALLRQAQEATIGYLMALLARKP